MTHNGAGVCEVALKAKHILMHNDIQKLIDEMKLDLSKTQWDLKFRSNTVYETSIAKGKIKVLDKYIQKLTLLLNDTGASTPSAAISQTRCWTKVDTGSDQPTSE